MTKQKSSSTLKEVKGIGINIFTKKGRLKAMVERLKEFVISLETEKADIESADFEEVIKTKVADFEKQVRAEFAEMRSKRIAEKEVEINVVNRLIETEEKRIEEEAYKQFLEQRELANSVEADEAELEAMLENVVSVDASAENL